MKVTIQQLLNYFEFYEAIKSAELPIKLAYKLHKINQCIEPELIFYRDQLNALIQKYGEKDKNGEYVMNDDESGIKVSDENAILVQKELVALQEMEVDMIDCHISIDDFPDTNITLQSFHKIAPFIKD